MRAYQNDVAAPMSNPFPLTACGSPKPSCSFVDRLPVELRVEIYKDLFRGKVSPAIRTAGMSRWSARPMEARFRDRSVISILQTCRLCRSEAQWIFRQEVAVAFTKPGLAIATVMLAGTMFDTMELRQIVLVSPQLDASVLKGIQLACPKLETVYFVLHDARSPFPTPLRTLIDSQDSNLAQMAQDGQKLSAVFFSILRYDWLAISNVAEFSTFVSRRDYSGPRVLFGSPVVFEQRPGHELQPDSDGGYLTLDPKTKTVEWQFRGLLTKGRYTFKSAPHRELKWSFEVFD